MAASGGADSTAMVLRLHELGERFKILFTPTGNELPGVRKHLDMLVRRTGAELVVPPGPSLETLIEQFSALPNWRQRWCTRMIKIVPCIAYLKRHPGEVLCVGLRADEPERTGLYGEFATYRYPLREWGWSRPEVEAYNLSQWVMVPPRTDCAVCYGQQLGEWHALWRDHPAEYARGEAWEAQTGHTFRSKGRDTWPAALAELRAEFEKGRVPKASKRGRRRLVVAGQAPCRVCRED